jgi:poly(3-hydroxybutyrate) depolymerase
VRFRGNGGEGGSAFGLQSGLGCGDLREAAMTEAAMTEAFVCLGVRARRGARFIALAFALAAALSAVPGASAQAAEGAPAEKLGAFPVDASQVSVAGISSGAFMANQIHIAHSADVMGAAMIAGGLYGCAVESVEDDGVRALATQAYYDCMQLPDNLKEVGAYSHEVKQLAAKGWIDPLANLARSKLYLFTGGSDTVVNPKTVKEAARLYAALGVPPSNIAFVDESGPAAHAGHSWVTASCCEACEANDSPYIDDCRYDQAGAELNAIYGPNLSAPAAVPTGRIVAFDQQEFAPGGATKVSGLSDTGYLYVPKACETGAAQPCRLHVVLHGCEQSAETLGDTFYTRIGVNEWADSNRILVLYPQAHAIEPQDLPPELLPLAAVYANPDGCWNWWGYADDRQYLTRKGVQVSAIWAMVERIEGK